tara:strand:+ start:3672 stop:3890 length:219 start_codon:yes stop_codon:yes gene_type:complete
MVMSKKEEKKRATKRTKPKLVKKTQSLQSRLNEAEGKKKGMKKKKQGVGARLDEAEPKKRNGRRNYGGAKKK